MEREKKTRQANYPDGSHSGNKHDVNSSAAAGPARLVLELPAALEGTAREPLLRGYFRQLPLAVKPLDRQTLVKALIPPVRRVFGYLAPR